MAMQHKQNKQKMAIQNFPSIEKKYMERVLTGIRPFRKGGIRLETQQINNKKIVHNYGHGGAGVSLAPATAIEATELVQSILPNRKQTVAVLGCGIVGLMTAIQIKNKGYDVMVYANRVPLPLQKNTSLMCTSQIAPGYWLPYHYQYPSQQQGLHDKRSQISFKKYIQYMRNSSSIREVPVFQEMDINQIIKNAPEFISKTCKKVSIQAGDKQVEMVYFETLQIHLQNFLQQLIDTSKQQNIRFKEIKFNSINDVLQLKQNVLVNCLGLGSKQIFNDKNVYGVKGHLIQLKNINKTKGIISFKYEDKPIKLYCFDDKILLGLTKQYKETMDVNDKLVGELLDRGCRFYKSLNINQKEVRPKL